jgi:predicted anti-sigma-YlaC factor YlaD
MKCSAVRDRLLRPATGLDTRTATGHLAGCPACRRFALGLAEARRDLRDHHAGIEPDATFVARLRNRLETGPQEMAGRAALRLLPLSLALLLLLLLISAGTAPLEQTPTSEETAQAYINWVLQAPDEAS